MVYILSIKLHKNLSNKVYVREVRFISMPFCVLDKIAITKFIQGFPDYNRHDINFRCFNYLKLKDIVIFFLQFLVMHSVYNANVYL